jgi:phosphoglycolate phosphatase
MLGLEKYFKNKTHIIWDWNGTLLDDVRLCAEITNELLTERGLPGLGLEEHRKLFRMPVKDYYQELGFNLSATEWPIVANIFVERYRERVKGCSLFEGARELLNALRGKDKKLAILSAANENDLHRLLQHYGIDDFFEHVCGLSDVYAASKIERGAELLNKWEVARSNVILVGDMDHDLEVGESLGIDVVVLGDGHQHSARLLLKCKDVILSRYACD